jgi:hypothetical protein
MAHFAKIELGIVTQVVVVDDQHEADGQAYLSSLGLEGAWVQTSYSGSIRGKFAGIGDTYNSELDEFIAPYVQPELPVQEVVQLPVPAPTEPTTPVE